MKHAHIIKTGGWGYPADFFKFRFHINDGNLIVSAAQETKQDETNLCSNINKVANEPTKFVIHRRLLAERV